MGEEFQWNGLWICPLEAHLYTEDEYKSNMGIESEGVPGTEDGEYRVICVKLRVSNHTGEDIAWDTVFDQFGYGFETRTWCSVASPFLTRRVNVFSSDTFADGATQEFWLATTANRVIFSTQRWKALDREAIYYVMNVQPNRKVIRLECD